jgi:hypothetical protein
MAQGTLVNLATPLTVCRDIHGKFYDLLSLSQQAASPNTQSLLRACKVRHPERASLLRGSYECHQVNPLYGFSEETVQ